MLERSKIDYSVPWALARERRKCTDCGVEELHSDTKGLIIAVHVCTGCGRRICKRCLFRHQDFFRHSDHRHLIDSIPPPVKPIVRRSTQVTREQIDRIRDSTDIVRLVSQHVALKQIGRVYWGLCPFHKEKSASFNVRTDPARFHCFGCGEDGDVFKFVMLKEGLTFPEAVRQLGAL
jgi:hypothetical protein